MNAYHASSCRCSPCLDSRYIASRDQFDTGATPDDSGSPVSRLDSMTSSEIRAEMETHKCPSCGALDGVTVRVEGDTKRATCSWCAFDVTQEGR